MEFKGNLASVCEYLEIMPIFNDRVKDLLTKIKVTGIECDTRRVTPGCIFYAKRGLHYNPFEHIAEVKAKGAVAILIDCDESVTRSSLFSCIGSEEQDQPVKTPHQSVIPINASPVYNKNIFAKNFYYQEARQHENHSNNVKVLPPWQVRSHSFEKLPYQNFSSVACGEIIVEEPDSPVEDEAAGLSKEQKQMLNPKVSLYKNGEVVDTNASSSEETKSEQPERRSIVPKESMSYEELKRAGYCINIRPQSNPSLALDAYSSMNDSPEAQAIIEAHCLRLVLPPHKSLSGLAGFIYGEPSSKLRLIGVTGTNGKSTVTHMIAQMLNISGHRCAIFGTLGYGFLDDMKRSANTTLDAITLQQKLAEYVKLGADYAVLEVSSIGHCEGRTAGLHFYAGGFTNLSRDHLDYHVTMGDYYLSKMNFLKQIPSQRLSLNINAADARSLYLDMPLPEAMNVGVENRELVENITYNRNYINVKKVVYNPSSLELYLNSSLLGKKTIRTTLNLLGGFNVENYVLALGIMVSMGFECRYLASITPKIKPVTGRMECFTAPNKPRMLVDYAHTPDGIEKALRAARSHTSSSGRIFALVGCGGDRDKGKRPLMAQKACLYADYAFFTADNPRSEHVEDIIDDMILGVARYPASNYLGLKKNSLDDQIDTFINLENIDCEKTVRSIVEDNAVFADLDKCMNRYWLKGQLPKELPHISGPITNAVVILDRRQAIEFAFAHAKPQDCIVIAGKGHEDYQILNDKTIHFSDREICCELLGIELPPSNVHESKVSKDPASEEQKPLAMSVVEEQQPEEERVKAKKPAKRTTAAKKTTAKKTKVAAETQDSTTTPAKPKRARAHKSSVDEALSGTTEVSAKKAPRGRPKKTASVSAAVTKKPRGTVATKPKTAAAEKKIK